jgi:hypothetical protein
MAKFTVIHGGENMTGRIYPTLRKAIHYTVRDFCNRDGAKTLLLCEALKCAPATLSAMTAEYEQSSSRNPSPEDLEIIMATTGDDSIAMTAADLRGRETSPKRDRFPEIVQALTSEAKRLTDSIQLVLATPWVQQQTTKGKR